MAERDKVIWSEGMFLQPHHLQQNDRYLENLITQRPGLVEARQWGITQLTIDETLLIQGKFGITNARGILPDGTAFDIPARDRAPTPITIPAGISNTEILLTLPLHRAGSAAAGRDSSVQHQLRYHIETIEMQDNNADSESIAPIQIGKLALSLQLGDADLQGFSGLAVAKIQEARSDQQIILDAQHIPPCITIKAAKQLPSLLQEIQGLMHYRGDMLVQRLAEGNSGGVAEIADFLLLQIINRYEPLLIHLNNSGNPHPEWLYRIFIQLIGELCTFTHSQRRPPQLPVYLHDDLHKTFLPLIAELRRALSIVLAENAIALKIEQQGSATWTATLSDKTLLNNATFILAVHANISPETIRTTFPAQTKIAPVEALNNLIARALPGIELRPLAVAPRQIPYHAEYVYFSLHKAHALWPKLQSSSALALHIGGEFPELHLELWAIKEKSAHD